MLRRWLLPILSFLIAVTLIAIFVVTAALSVRGQSSTWDEPMHLTAGLAQLQTGDARLVADHPPLVHLLAALPALFIPMGQVSELSAEAWKRADGLSAPTALMGDIEGRLLWFSRLTLLSLAVLLGALLYAWGSQLFGPRAALLPLALLAFCPPLLANAPIIATDFAVTTFIFAAIYGWWRYLDTPSLARLAWVSLAVAAAFVSKHSAILLVPMMMLLGLVSLVPKKGDQPRILRERILVLVKGGVAIGALTWFVINLMYGFDGVFLRPDAFIDRAAGLDEGLKNLALALGDYWPQGLPLPLPYYYVLGLLYTLTHVQLGHLTYFLGEVSSGGWTNYAPMMLLIKFPVPTLILMGLGVIVCLDRLPRGFRNPLFLLLPSLLIIWTVTSGNLQIGIRHLLPAIPFLLMLTGYAAQLASNRWRQVLIGLLVVGTAWSSLSVFPYYLMYFNFLAGGPDQGWRISIEGDDWGQGGAELVRWLRERGVRELAYGGFGWSGTPVMLAGIGTKPVPCEDNGELVAIHAGNLLKVQTLEQVKCYAWMRMRKPDEKIGYSIFLYNSHSPAPPQRLVPRPPPPADLDGFNQALEAQLSGHLEQAIALYRDYLASQPDYYQARFNLGHALMTIGRYAEAIEEFQRTLALWSGYTETHLHLARCYHALGQEEAAQRHEGQQTGG